MKEYQKPEFEVIELVTEAIASVSTEDGSGNIDIGD